MKLISVSKLTSNLTCSLFFFSDFVFIQDLNHWKLIGVGKHKGGLYFLQESGGSSINSRSLPSFPLAKQSLNCSKSSKIALFDVWHHRSGHPSVSRLQLLHNNDSCIDFVESEFPCLVCPLAKQKKLPFPISTHISECPFELVHCDVWDPFSTHTIEGHNFFLTIVDDCTRAVWIYLLKCKSEVAVLIPQFFKLVKTQFNTKIKNICTDLGTEFSLTSFLKSKGVIHQLSCVETRSTKFCC